ncbi:MAG: UvrD-helicase domain-containing protein [Deltaproteobacteria bacterium]|nr:UvrD-helicase domain-containing protein [Deltaproteobacteria bacterium]
MTASLPLSESSVGPRLSTENMYLADLHIHSHFSLATAKNMNLPHLELWARRKGIRVVGTGDCTHPGWVAEIESSLIPDPDAPGLLRLRPGLSLSAAGGDEYAAPGGSVSFVLTAEISSIYKKLGRVRKVHTLLLMPHLEAVKRLNQRLAAIGNIVSDGRPILGLDARHLLELVLHTTSEALVIPAHIWTPWFSILGSKSGFDQIEECYEDLTGEIHALETGLSSDPLMNWRLSALDRYTLVSNSDAHSPAMLGREVNLISGAPSYAGLTSAITGGVPAGFLGTLEFFPEEGKYHLDGHRHCHVRLDPEETRTNSGNCPVCGRPVTVGVMNRVMTLADRPAGFRPDAAADYRHILALPEIVGQILDVGSQSKQVTAEYYRLLLLLGPELDILTGVPEEDLTKAGGPLLARGIMNMRQGRVSSRAGFDGEYGVIDVFSPGEKTALRGQGRLLATPAGQRKMKKSGLPTLINPQPASHSATKSLKSQANRVSDFRLNPCYSHSDPILGPLNMDQQRAVTLPPGPLLIMAGPGTGKTRTLSSRVTYLIQRGLARPQEILAITFTRKAAAEMAHRIKAQVPQPGSDNPAPELTSHSLLNSFSPGATNFLDIYPDNFPTVCTFHALAGHILSLSSRRDYRIIDEDTRLALARQITHGTPIRPRELVDLVSGLKQQLAWPPAADSTIDKELLALLTAYDLKLQEDNALDFDDLIHQAVKLLQEDATRLKSIQESYRHILVDEYQDINYSQFTLLRLLCSGDRPNLLVIGDPDQAIYGFRGADAGYFRQFITDYPQAEIIRLTKNYRSSDNILDAAHQVIQRNRDKDRIKVVSGIAGEQMISLADFSNDRAEADFVVKEIITLIGGSSHLSLETSRASRYSQRLDVGFSDIAILYRLHALSRPLEQALSEAGIPFQKAGEAPLAEVDELDFTAEKVSLLTMHSAKGLEFKVVFIVGLEDNIIPYRPENRPAADEAEERRLFYVALTRAGSLLYLTRARSRFLYGQQRRDPICPFLRQIEKGLLHQPAPAAGKRAKQIKQPQQLSLFTRSKTTIKN